MIWRKISQVKTRHPIIPSNKQTMSNEELILSPIHEAAKRGYSAQIEELLVQVPNAQEKEKLLASVDTYGNT